MLFANFRAVLGLSGFNAFFFLTLTLGGGGGGGIPFFFFIISSNNISNEVSSSTSTDFFFFFSSLVIEAYEGGFGLIVVAVSFLPSSFSLLYPVISGIVVYYQLPFYSVHSS